MNRQNRAEQQHIATLALERREITDESLGLSPCWLEWQVQKLTPKQKKVFTYRYYDGLPYKEIGRRMKIQDSSVRMTMHKAVFRIKLLAKKSRLLAVGKLAV